MLAETELVVDKTQCNTVLNWPQVNVPDYSCGIYLRIYDMGMYSFTCKDMARLCPHTVYLYMQTFMWWIYQKYQRERSTHLSKSAFCYTTEVITPNYVRLEKHPGILITLTKKVSLGELFFWHNDSNIRGGYLTRLENWTNKRRPDHVHYKSNSLHLRNSLFLLFLLLLPAGHVRLHSLL